MKWLRLLLSLFTFVPLLIGAIGCGQKSQTESESAIKSDWQDDMVYEGKVPLDSTTYLELIVELNASTDTEGNYSLLETVMNEDQKVNSFFTEGFYTILGDEMGRPVLVLQNSSHDIPLRRTSITERGRLREENFRNTDLKFYMLFDKLQVLDNDQAFTSSVEYLLYQKTSPTFTVEGYFTYRGDTSFFHEINTGQDWPVSKLGAYYQAAREHNTLAEKKNDTTYLKATAYCIKSINKSRKPIQALVFHRILQTSSK